MGPVACGWTVSTLALDHDLDVRSSETATDDSTASYYRPTVSAVSRPSVPTAYYTDVKIEVRASGLKAMREKRGLTQRKLAHGLGISRNYIRRSEANSRQAGPI